MPTKNDSFNLEPGSTPRETPDNQLSPLLPQESFLDYFTRVDEGTHRDNTASSYPSPVLSPLELPEVSSRPSDAYPVTPYIASLPAGQWRQDAMSALSASASPANPYTTGTIDPALLSSDAQTISENRSASASRSSSPEVPTSVHGMNEPGKNKRKAEDEISHEHGSRTRPDKRRMVPTTPTKRLSARDESERLAMRGDVFHAIASGNPAAAAMKEKYDRTFRQAVRQASDNGRMAGTAENDRLAMRGEVFRAIASGDPAAAAIKEKYDQTFRQAGKQAADSGRMAGSAENDRLAMRGEVLRAIANGDPAAAVMKGKYDQTFRGENRLDDRSRSRNDRSGRE